LNLRPTDLRGRAHAHQVLRLQPRLGPAGANVEQMKWFPGQQRQRQTGPQNLTAPFAQRTVQFDH
jgi:hypothetical protein